LKQVILKQDIKTIYSIIFKEMPLNINVSLFKDLIDKYPTWNELQTYLESEEGGQFRIVDRDETNGICLIRYDKTLSKMDLPHSRWFRSVIWNMNTNRPVCIAPPKASVGEFPFHTVDELVRGNLVCQELLDGFMINCFHTADSPIVYINSRSKLGATGTFYSSKTLKQLFLEAYTETLHLSHSEPTTTLNKPNTANGEIATFYSFLVQHKEHRIVKNIKENRVFLIHSGTVYEDGRVEIVDSPTNFDGIPNIETVSFENTTTTLINVDGVTEIPLEDSTMYSVETRIKKFLQGKSWEFQGIVFKDAQGNRWRFRNDKYSTVKLLHGNSPTIRERFAQLYTQNLVDKYLEYYPEDMYYMNYYKIYMSVIVNKLYAYYVELHIRKRMIVDEVPKMYLPHLYNIHGIYLSHLRPNSQKVKMEDIQMYLHKQPWQRIVFLIKNLDSVPPPPNV